MKKSKHAIKRLQQRGFREDDVDLVVGFGQESFCGGGATKYFLSHQNAKETIAFLQLMIKRLQSLAGKGVVVAEDGTMVTAMKVYK